MCMPESFKSLSLLWKQAFKALLIAFKKTVEWFFKRLGESSTWAAIGLFVIALRDAGQVPMEYEEYFNKYTWIVAVIAAGMSFILKEGGEDDSKS